MTLIKAVSLAILGFGVGWMVFTPLIAVGVTPITALIASGLFMVGVSYVLGDVQ